jgi:hypothetical protein
MDTLHTNVNEDYTRFMDWFSWTYGPDACPLPRHLVEWKNRFPKYWEKYEDPFYNWVSFVSPAQKARALEEITARLFHHEPPTSIPSDDSSSEASDSRSESLSEASSSDSLSESRSLSTESCSETSSQSSLGSDALSNFIYSGLRSADYKLSSSTDYERRFDFDTPSLSESSSEDSEHDEDLAETATEMRTSDQTTEMMTSDMKTSVAVSSHYAQILKEKQLWKKKPSVSNEMMTSEMMEDSLSEISQPFSSAILPFAPLSPCRFQELSEKNQIGLRLKWKNFLDAPVGNTKYLVINFAMEYYRGSHDLFAFHQKLKEILTPHEMIDFYRLITVEC